jgi:hypothetical protein
MAKRRGFRLVKSRARDPRAIGFAGFMLVDSFKNSVVVGGAPYSYSATLDEVEAFLES